MSNAEVIYSGFLANLDKALGKIDMELALKVMLYERKMPDVAPAVELEIHYLSGTNTQRKISEIRDKYGFEVASYEENVVLAKGNMDMSLLQTLSQDPQIERLTGFATVASY